MAPVFMEFIFFIKKNFFNFCLCWVFVAARGLSLVAVSRDYVVVHGLLIAVACLLQGTGSRRVGFSSCGTRA